MKNDSTAVRLCSFMGSEVTLTLVVLKSLQCSPSGPSSAACCLKLSQIASMECDPDPVFVSKGQRSSYRERVVLQVAQQRVWEGQLVEAVCVSVDGEASQVLQRRENLVFVQRIGQLQRDSVVFGCML